MKGISIVICTHNGVARIGKTLLSILNQELDTQCWELIVIDNASTDDTDTFCRKLLADQGKQIKWQIVYESQPGLNYARLRGLNTAVYDIVLFCDDDNHLKPGYLSIGYELMQSHPEIGALGGHGIALFEQAAPNWFNKYAYSFAVGPQARENGKLKEKPAEVYGAGCFFRVPALKKLFASGFTTIMTDRLGKTLASGGDVEWCYLEQLLGFEVWYDDRLQFDHEMPVGRMNWGYYLKLKRGIASGAGRMFAYQEFFKNPNLSAASFKSQWKSRTQSNSISLLKSKVGNILKPTTSHPDRQLALTRLLARKEAFDRDYDVAVEHYQQLQQYFKK